MNKYFIILLYALLISMLVFTCISLKHMNEHMEDLNNSTLSTLEMIKEVNNQELSSLSSSELQFVSINGKEVGFAPNLTVDQVIKIFELAGVTEQNTISLSTGKKKPQLKSKNEDSSILTKTTLPKKEIIVTSPDSLLMTNLNYNYKALINYDGQINKQE